MLPMLTICSSDMRLRSGGLRIRFLRGGFSSLLVIVYPLSSKYLCWQFVQCIIIKAKPHFTGKIGFHPLRRLVKALPLMDNATSTCRDNVLSCESCKWYYRINGAKWRHEAVGTQCIEIRDDGEPFNQRERSR